METYISKLYKHAVQTMLKAEMDEHLGYKKHDPVGKNTGNSRNGSSGKTLKTDIGDIPLDKITIDIFGIWGERIITETLIGERKHEFSLSDRPSGVYFIRVITDDKSETLKIIKQ